MVTPVSLVLALLIACPPTVEVDGDNDGWLVSEGDCDDTDRGVNPDASEICNDIDDDCDTEVDEEPTDGLSWFADQDGDGHGDPNDERRSCELPDGAALVGDDCDDTDPAYYPDAPEDECDDDPGDYNCDGGLGPEDFDGDGVRAGAACGDCDDGDGEVHTGHAELCDGKDNNCDGVIDEGC